MSVRRSLILLVVLALSATLLAACGGGGAPSASTVTITVSDDLKYTPNVITAKPGDTVTVSFVNNGKTDHTFVAPDLKISVQLPAGKTTPVTFTAPAAGTYTFQCDVPGHKEAGMVGTIVVQ